MTIEPIETTRGSAWHGIMPVAPTPFLEDGSIDFQGYRRNISTLIESGVHGVISLATAGEGPSMSAEESLKVVAAAREAAGDRVPVLAGVGGPNVQATAALMCTLQATGVDGFLVVCPYFYPLTRDELLAYFRRIGSVTNLPLMIYNSTYTATPLVPDIVERLATDVPTFVALKEGNQAQASDVIRRLRGRITVFASRDLHIHELLAAGGAGAIAFTANIIPAEVVRLYDLAVSGRLDEARAIQDEINPLVWAVVSRSFPAGIKAGMELKGFAGGFVRPPLTDYTPEERSHVSEVLSRMRLGVPAGMRQ